MRRHLTWLNALRYGLPAVLVIVGFVILAVAPDSTRWDGWSMFCGAGLAVLLLNQLYRFGATGDKERTAEDDAREFLGKHGYWPDEVPPGGSVRATQEPDPERARGTSDASAHQPGPARPRGAGGDSGSGRLRSPHGRPRRRP